MQFPTNMSDEAYDRGMAKIDEILALNPELNERYMSGDGEFINRLLAFALDDNTRASDFKVSNTGTMWDNLDLLNEIVDTTQGIIVPRVESTDEEIDLFEDEQSQDIDVSCDIKENPEVSAGISYALDQFVHSECEVPCYISVIKDVPALYNYLNSFAASVDDDINEPNINLNDLQRLIDFDNIGLISCQEHIYLTNWGAKCEKIEVSDGLSSLDEGIFEPPLANAPENFILGDDVPDDYDATEEMSGGDLLSLLRTATTHSDDPWSDVDDTAMFDEDEELIEEDAEDSFEDISFDEDDETEEDSEVDNTSPIKSGILYDVEGDEHLFDEDDEEELDAEFDWTEAADAEGEDDDFDDEAILRAEREEEQGVLFNDELEGSEETASEDDLFDIDDEEQYDEDAISEELDLFEMDDEAEESDEAESEEMFDVDDDIEDESEELESESDELFDFDDEEELLDSDEDESEDEESEEMFDTDDDEDSEEMFDTSDEDSEEMFDIDDDESEDTESEDEELMFDADDDEPENEDTDLEMTSDADMFDEEDFEDEQEFEEEESSDEGMFETNDEETDIDAELDALLGTVESSDDEDTSQMFDSEFDDLYDALEDTLEGTDDSPQLGSNPLVATDFGVPTASQSQRVPRDKNEAAAETILSLYNKLVKVPSIVKRVFSNMFSNEGDDTQ